MKKYIVAIISFFDNDIRQFQIEAESPYEAVKKGMVEFCSEEYRESEIEWQKSENYPKDLDSLEELLANSDMDCSVIEVGSFFNE